MLLGFTVCSVACASASVLDIKNYSSITLAKFAEEIQPGSVLLVGESHAMENQKNLDQKNQIELIQTIAKQNKSVSLGMEFISFDHQKDLDTYVKGKTNDPEFLNAVGWKDNPFKYYKQQMLVTALSGGQIFGLNSPKELTNYVTKNGVEKLTSDQLSLMPPNFELGRESYKKRFFDKMSYIKHHGGDLEFYFHSQSIWDDTMAWRISEIMKANPDSILVVQVGQFHIMYGGGLPDRLNERGVKNVKTLLQSSSFEGFSESQLESFIHDKKYGLISDYYW